MLAIWSQVSNQDGRGTRFGKFPVIFLNKLSGSYPPLYSGIPIILSLLLTELSLYSYPPVWRRQWRPLQYSCLENPMDRGAWWAAVHGVARSWDTPEWLHFHFSLSCTGEGNGNPLLCSCLENPRDGGAWWAAVYGVAQSRTRLKRLTSSSILQSFYSFFHLVCPVTFISFIEFFSSRICLVPFYNFSLFSKGLFLVINFICKFIELPSHDFFVAQWFSLHLFWILYHLDWNIFLYVIPHFLDFSWCLTTHTSAFIFEVADTYPS